MQPTTFNTIPTGDELGDIQRDLRFHCSTTFEPNVLSLEQINHYNEHGYVMPIRFFSTEEMTQIRAYFEQLLSQYLAEGKDSYSISSAHLRHGKVWDILTNPRIVAVVRDLIGESVIAWGSHFFCKLPGDGKSVSWHQDASYWPLTPSKAVTVWLAIDDADRGNACMKYIPRTQTLGHLTYQLSETDESNVLNQTVPGIEQYGEPVYVELKAGEAAIHSDLLLHGSEVNNSTRRRCGLTLRYTTGDVKAYLGWAEKGIVVSGVAPDHWANRSRPTEE
jgi:non-haem Fe2+, alpha-ketoglutarate-dependent halogenase